MKFFMERFAPYFDSLHRSTSETPNAPPSFPPSPRPEGIFKIFRLAERIAISKAELFKGVGAKRE